MPSRRDHLKSRRGCGQCKSRHIKCDEVPPSCGSCTKKRLQCDYQNVVAAPASQRLPTPKVPTFVMQDLSLLHHYTLATSHTIGAVDDDVHRKLWQSEAPKLATRYEFLMRAILSVAAAHIAATEPEKRVEYLHISRDNYGKALVCFRDTVQAVDVDRLEAVYCFSVLVMIITFSYGVIDLSADRDCISSMVEVFNTVRAGAQVIPRHSTSANLKDIAIGRILGISREVEPRPVPEPISEALTHANFLVDSRDRYPARGDVGILHAALEQLRAFFTIVAIRPTNLAFLLRWPIYLSPGFIELLREREPATLVMLAFWCVPVHNSPGRWYLGQSMKQLVLQIFKLLENTAWHSLIAWPLAQVSTDNI